MSARPAITLNNGVALPSLGLGVFQSPPAETVTAVESAIATGYRLIDTAAAYFNEREVGEGIRRSGIARAEVFIESKVWISDYGYDETLHAFDKSARKLGVDQLDLLLLHPSRSLRSMRSTPARVADRTPTASPWRPTASRSPRRDPPRGGPFGRSRPSGTTHSSIGIAGQTAQARTTGAIILIRTRTASTISSPTQNH